MRPYEPDEMTLQIASARHLSQALWSLVLGGSKFEVRSPNGDRVKKEAE